MVLLLIGSFDCLGCISLLPLRNIPASGAELFAFPPPHTHSTLSTLVLLSCHRLETAYTSRDCVQHAGEPLQGPSRGVYRHRRLRMVVGDTRTDQLYMVLGFRLCVSGKQLQWLRIGVQGNTR